MPLFEYFCSHCHKRFEKLVRSTQQEAECPTCGNLCPKVFSTFRTSGTSGAGGSGCSTCSSSSCSTCN